MPDSGTPVFFHCAFPFRFPGHRRNWESTGTELRDLALICQEAFKEISFAIINIPTLAPETSTLPCYSWGVLIPLILWHAFVTYWTKSNWAYTLTYFLWIDNVSIVFFCPTPSCCFPIELQNFFFFVLWQFCREILSNNSVSQMLYQIFSHGRRYVVRQRTECKEGSPGESGPFSRL